MHVWNLNFYPPCNGRGANEVIIRTSTNATDWITEGAYFFTMASGMAGDLRFDIDASGWHTACYTEFQILSKWELCTNVVLPADACSIAFPFSNREGRAFYRVHSK